MRALLKFDLDDENDKHAFYLMNSAANMARVIGEYASILRGAYKHGIDEKIQNREDIIEYFRDRFSDLLCEFNITSSEL